MRQFELAAHQARQLLQYDDPAPAEGVNEIDPRPEMLCFRGQTLALVRHFFELSCQVGRLPSLLGREFFRARVSHHSIPSFEDQAVFVRDVELCLSRLSDDHAEIITLVGLYDFSLDEVAEMLHSSRSVVHLWFSEALDSLSEILLQAGLLSENHPDRRQRQVTSRGLPADVAALEKKPPRGTRKVPENDSEMPKDCSPACNCEPLLA